MFKKTLSVVLAMLMVLSCMTALIVPAAAVETPTGTAIDSLDDITDLTADYYLSADIGSADALNTISVGDESNAFTGTLNGNGKTIYTSVPVFALLGEGAEVKNLTTRGSISVSEAGYNTWVNAGAIAAAATGAFTVTDCTNYVNIGYSVANAHANIGGFVGLAMKSGVVMTNCTNYGKLYQSVAGASKQGRVGGMIGFTHDGGGTVKSVYTSCKNYGAIEDKSSISLIGGMFGQYNGKEAFDLISCENYGSITGANASSKLGGLIGVASQAAVHTYTSCKNEGVINGNTIAGGLVGQDSGTFTFTSCENKGNVYLRGGNGNTFVGGIIGYATNSLTTTSSIISCSNTATEIKMISGTNGKTTLFGGIVGHLEKSTKYVIKDCVNLANVSTNNTGGGVKTGGIVGVVGGVLDISDCVNKGNIYSATLTGGMIAQANKNVTIHDCINLGNVTNEQKLDGTNCFAAGILTMANNISLTAYNLANYGDITAIPFQNTDKTYDQSYAAGIIGTNTNVSTNVYDCANYGTVKSNYAVGGIMGKYTLTSGSFARCVNFGSLGNYSEGTSIYYYTSAIIATMATNNTDASKMITLTDCYGTNARAIGIYAAPTDTKGNLKVVYTDAKVEDTVIGGTDTTESANYSEVLLRYNKTYTSNGVVSKENAKGYKAAHYMSALDFGGAWIVRESYPELACVETLLENSTNTATEATVTYKGVQYTEVNGDTFNVRFVSAITDLESFNNVGVKVYMIEKGSKDIYELDRKDNVVYEQVLANNEDGVPEVYPEQKIEGTYFSALTVNGISATGTYTFYVTPYTESIDGETVSYGSAIAIVFSNGKYVTQYWAAAPTR